MLNILSYLDILDINLNLNAGHCLLAHNPEQH